MSAESRRSVGSPVCRQPGGRVDQARRLRSIQAVFSCTCRRWVSRSAVGSSWACSTSGEHRAGGAGDGLLTLDETADHLGGVGSVVVLGDRRERRELAVAGRCGRAERADALGDEVDGEGELVVLRLEHEVQCLEHRAGDVPVVVVGLEIQRVGVGEQPGQTVGDGPRSASSMPMSMVRSVIEKAPSQVCWRPGYGPRTCSAQTMRVAAESGRGRRRTLRCNRSSRCVPRRLVTRWSPLYSARFANDIRYTLHLEDRRNPCPPSITPSLSSARPTRQPTTAHLLARPSPVRRAPTRPNSGWRRRPDRPS